MLAFWKRLKELEKQKKIAMFVTNITKPLFFKVRGFYLFVCLFFKDLGNVLY